MVKKRAPIEHFDPATNRLILNTKKSMADMSSKNMASMSRKDIIQEQKDITDNIKAYMSTANKFSIRMSASIAHGKVRSPDEVEQSNLFVDDKNV